MATEFAVDDSNTTTWRSHDSETPVTFVAGLDMLTVISKILITFSPSPTYQKAMLQVSSSAGSQWEDLQYYAVDCMESFEVDTNARLERIIHTFYTFTYFN